MKNPLNKSKSDRFFRLKFDKISPSKRNTNKILFYFHTFWGCNLQRFWKSDKVYGNDPEGGGVVGMKVGWWCEWGGINVFSLRDEFYDVAKVTIIYT